MNDGIKDKVLAKNEDVNLEVLMKENSSDKIDAH
jgi:hypothetical protein